MTYADWPDVTYALLGGSDLLGLVLVFVGHYDVILFSRLLSGSMTRLVACESSCYATRHGEAGRRQGSGIGNDQERSPSLVSLINKTIIL